MVLWWLIPDVCEERENCPYSSLFVYLNLFQFCLYFVCAGCTQFSPVTKFCSVDTRCALRAVNSAWHGHITIPGTMLPSVASMMHIQNRQAFFKNVKKHMNVNFIVGPQQDSGMRPLLVLQILAQRGHWKQAMELTEIYDFLPVDKRDFFPSAIEYDNYEDVCEMLGPCSNAQEYLLCVHNCCKFGKTEMFRLCTSLVALEKRDWVQFFQYELHVLHTELQHATAYCANVAMLDVLCQSPLFLHLQTIPDTVISTWQFPVLRDLIRMKYELRPNQWTQVKVALQRRWMSWITTGHFVYAWELLSDSEMTEIVATQKIGSAIVRMLLAQQQTLLLRRLLAPPFSLSADVQDDARHIMLLAGQTAGGLRVIQNVPCVLDFVSRDRLTNVHLLQNAIMRCDNNSFDVLCHAPYDSHHNTRRWQKSFLVWLGKHATSQTLMMLSSAMTRFPAKSHRLTATAVFQCTQRDATLARFVCLSSSVSPFMGMCAEMAKMHIDRLDNTTSLCADYY